MQLTEVGDYEAQNLNIKQMLNRSTNAHITTTPPILGNAVMWRFSSQILIKMEIYKGYELFSDAAYYDMICIRKEGSRDFNETIHVSTVQEAKQTIDEMITLSDYMDWYNNKYGGVIMVSEYWIKEFVSSH
jgi:hypothetical protein